MPKHIPGSAQFRDLMPHPFPCWCRECVNAYAKCMYRVRKGLAADWTPKPRACEWCGWSFVPHPARHQTKRWCSNECRNASKGWGTPADSCRLYHYKCHDCGVALGIGGRRKDFLKCSGCRVNRHRIAADCVTCGSAFMASRASVYARRKTGRQYATYCSKACYPPRRSKPKPEPPDRCEIPWRACGWCERTFIGLNNKKYCCKRCADYGIPGRRPLSLDIAYGACEACAVTFVRRADQLGAFCSSSCSKRVRKQQRKRRLRVAKRGAIAEPYTIRQIAERDGWRCHLCKKRVPDRPYDARPLDATVDHLIPVSAGGPDVLENVALAHNRCNWQRSNTGPAQLRLVG